ncbi:MAG: hypothetical protein EOP83_29565 [Verrucomicrobiaceae bacterium]|nr:MAG: hypothetical protein EOP83_29565 [Verrucomicrobiaceae bacterium]
MSDRERKLVLFFGLAAFVLVNFFAISWFQGKKGRIAIDLRKAKNEVETAEMAAGSFNTVFDEMKWLEEKSPSPKAGQLVSTELETYASNQASTHQLTIGKRDFKPNEETGAHFHRAKVQYKIGGREDSLYRWLDRLQMPDQFKAVTYLKLQPDAKDDTLIDAIVDVEQWYVPLTAADAAAETPEAGPEGTEEPDGAPATTPENIKPPGTE